IQAAQAIRGWAERTFPTDPNLQHAFLETLLPQGLGSFTTYLGVTATGTALGGPAGGILAGGLFGSSAGAAQAYFDALEHDADEETAVLAGELGAVVGASELVPVLRALNRFGLSKLSPAIRGKLARALWEGSKGAVEEALQEAGANTAYNLIARELYDHDRSLAQGLIEAGEVGGAVGFIGNFLMALIPGRRRRVRQPGEDAAADPDAL